MELLTQEQREKLLANGRAREADRLTGEETTDFAPVVKLYCPWSVAIWLLTEIDPDNQDVAFGLVCDPDAGFPALVHFSLGELASVTGPEGQRIESDPNFKATKTLSAYARDERVLRRI